MKKLNIYIIKQYIGTFIFTFFVAIFILLMQFLWTWVDEFIGKGVEYFEKIGINDTFGQSGKPAALLQEYGLTGPQIADRIAKAL